MALLHEYARQFEPEVWGELQMEEAARQEAAHAATIALESSRSRRKGKRASSAAPVTPRTRPRSAAAALNSPAFARLAQPTLSSAHKSKRSLQSPRPRSTQPVASPRATAASVKAKSNRREKSAGSSKGKSRTRKTRRSPSRSQSPRKTSSETYERVPSLLSSSRQLSAEPSHSSPVVSSLLAEHQHQPVISPSAIRAISISRKHDIRLPLATAASVPAFLSAAASLQHHSVADNGCTHCGCDHSCASNRTLLDALSAVDDQSVRTARPLVHEEPAETSRSHSCRGRCKKERRHRAGCSHRMSSSSQRSPSPSQLQLAASFTSQPVVPAVASSLPASSSSSLLLDPPPSTARTSVGSSSLVAQTPCAPSLALSKRRCEMRGCHERKLKGSAFRFCPQHEPPLSNPNARQQATLDAARNAQPV